MVDDEPRALTSLYGLLKYKHYQVDTALGGKLACQKLEQNYYDLVLLDLNMGDFDGYAVMAFMADKGINTAAVVVSGETTFDAVRKTLRMGASDYVKKPYSVEELFTAIDSILHKKHSGVNGLVAIVTASSGEASTMEKNALFNKAEQFGNLGYWEWDEIACRYTACSEQYAKFHGMTVEQMIEMVTSDEISQEFDCEEDRERYKEVVDLALERKQGWNIEYHSIDKEGKGAYLHEIGEPVLDGHGTIIKTIGTIQDITEIRLVEEALQQSHALFQQVEAMGKVGHWRWDLVEDKIISCSDQFARIYDMTVPEAFDYFISTDAEFNLVHPDNKVLFKKAEYDVNGQFKEFKVEYRVITLSGNTRHLYNRSEFVFDNDGAPSESFGTIQDITEIRRTEGALQRSHALYRQAEIMGSMGTFVGIAKG